LPPNEIIRYIDIPDDQPQYGIEPDVVQLPPNEIIRYIDVPDPIPPPPPPPPSPIKKRFEVYVKKRIIRKIEPPPTLVTNQNPELTFFDSNGRQVDAPIDGQHHVTGLNQDLYYGQEHQRQIPKPSQLPFNPPRR
jgi:hypothetical protein